MHSIETEDYKHKKPIIPFDQRIEIVKAIKYVDEVVPQTSMDKIKAWETLKFDALFHGNDWQNSDMYNKIINDLANLGVDVIFLPHTEGISSTDISKKIKI